MKVSRICSRVNVNLGIPHHAEKKVWITLKPPVLCEDLWASNKDSAFLRGCVNIPRRSQSEYGISLPCYRTFPTLPSGSNLFNVRSSNLSWLVRQIYTSSHITTIVMTAMIIITSVILILLTNSNSDNHHFLIT